MRQLHVALVARRQPAAPCGSSDEGALQSLATELHGLAWLQAAFQGACLRSLAGAGPAAGPDAHLPLHAAMAARLSSLLAQASAQASGIC